MSNREFAEPVPLDPPRPGYKNWISELPLCVFEVPKTRSEVDIFKLLHSRRSTRSFNPISHEDISSLLFYSAKTIEVERREVGPDWEHRPLPASGGCHAVQILISPPLSSDSQCGIYDHRAHGCRVLKNREAQSEASVAVQKMAIVGEPTLLIFFLDPARISGYYMNWEALVWRDSGVLTGGLSLVAAGLGLKFCPLGFVGTPLVRKFLQIENLIGLGACVVGS